MRECAFEGKKGAKKDVKKRKSSAHSAFIAYAFNCFRDQADNFNSVPPNQRLGVINRFKKSLPESALKQFETDYGPVLEGVNEGMEHGLDRTKGDLISLLKQRDEALGISIHPAFKGLKVRSNTVCKKRLTCKTHVA